MLRNIAQTTAILRREKHQSKVSFTSYNLYAFKSTSILESLENYKNKMTICFKLELVDLSYRANV